MCINKLEKQINYKFKNIALLEEAITHSSFQKNNLKIKKKNYERLEFLGDRVLGLVLSEYLFKTFPNAKEGVLDSYFQKFANQENLFNYAQKINLSFFNFKNNVIRFIRRNRINLKNLTTIFFGFKIFI